MKRLHN